MYRTLYFFVLRIKHSTKPEKLRLHQLYRVFQKFVPIFSSLKFHWLLKIPFVKLSMLFIIHLTLDNRNIANQNVFLYVFSHFLSGEACTSSQSVSTDTLVQCHLGAGSLYVFWSTIIQMVSRGFTSREFASRSPFPIKFPNPSDTMSACRRFLSSRLSNPCWS